MRNKRLPVWLSREAMLYDSPLYILKSFLGVFTAYILFAGHPIIGKDMISVLFAMVLTLEPVNRSGLRSGINQVKATLLGGLVSALLVGFLGVNYVTIPLAVALTMYMALVINWRFVSPVAIFTAIYMTQLVQVDALGNPSMLLTFRLRMLALAAGIVVAIFYNYIFSLFFYKSMLKKRLTFASGALKSLMAETPTTAHKERIVALLTDIDAIQIQLIDMQSDKKNSEEVMTYIKGVKDLRDLSHYYLDYVMDQTVDTTIKACKMDLEKMQEKLSEIIKKTT